MVILFVWLTFKASIRFTALSTRGVELERHLLSVNLDISSQAIVNRGGSWRGAPAGHLGRARGCALPAPLPSICSCEVECEGTFRDAY